MQGNPWKEWKKDKDARGFIEGFFDAVSDEITPPVGVMTAGSRRGRGWQMRTPLGKLIAETAFQLWHFYKEKEPEFLVEKLHLDVYPYSSGEVVGLSFVGRDCTWVTTNLDTDVDEEVMLGDMPVLTEKALDDLDRYLFDLTWEHDSLLRDIEERSEEEQQDIFYAIVADFAVPISSLASGEEFFSTGAHSIYPKISRGPTSGIPRISAKITHRYRRSLPKKGKKKGLKRRAAPKVKLQSLVFDQYEWDDIPIPYYAWDVGLAKVPYGALGYRED
jgi:hypothetical protein